MDSELLCCQLNFFIIILATLFYCLYYYSCLNFSLCVPFHTPLPPPSSNPTPSSTSTGHVCMFFRQSLHLLSSSTHLPPPLWQLSVFPCFYASDFILLISLFCSLDCTYKWGHNICLSVIGWFHLVLRVFSSIHAVVKGKNSLLFNSCRVIPVCKYTTAFLSTHQLMDTGCLQHLAIVNNAAMNIGCIRSFELVFQDS